MDRALDESGRAVSATKAVGGRTYRCESCDRPVLVRTTSLGSVQFVHDGDDWKDCPVREDSWGAVVFRASEDAGRADATARPIGVPAASADRRAPTPMDRPRWGAEARGGGGAPLLAAATISTRVSERREGAPESSQKVKTSAGLTGGIGHPSGSSESSGGVPHRPATVHWRLSDWAEEAPPPLVYAPPIERQQPGRTEGNEWRTGSHQSRGRRTLYGTGAIAFVLVLAGFIRQCGSSRLATMPEVSQARLVGDRKPSPYRSSPTASPLPTRATVVSIPVGRDGEPTESARIAAERNDPASVRISASETGSAGSAGSGKQVRPGAYASLKQPGTRPSYVRIYFRACEFPTHTMVRLNGKAVPGLDSRRLVEDLSVQSQALTPGEYELEVWMSPARLGEGQPGHAAVQFTLEEGRIVALQASFSTEAGQLILTAIPK